MSSAIKIVAITAVVMTIIDAVYLTLNRKMMETQVLSVQKTPISINIPATVACYTFLVLGLYYFILRQKRSLLDAFLFGLVIYGVYDTTNYAIFKNWKLSTVLIDVLWGGILMAITTYFVYKFI